MKAVRGGPAQRGLREGQEENKEKVGTVSEETQESGSVQRHQMLKRVSEIKLEASLM